MIYSRIAYHSARRGQVRTVTALNSNQQNNEEEDSRPVSNSLLPNNGIELLTTAAAIIGGIQQRVQILDAHIHAHDKKNSKDQTICNRPHHRNGR